MITISPDPIDQNALTEQVRSPRAGAVCTFLGTTREITGDRRTERLEYEAYPGMAEKKLEELSEQSKERWELIEVSIAHRLGQVDPGEISVVVAVSAPHRREAFEACQWLMDEIKRIVPIWKKEEWADGSHEWVHPGLARPKGQ